MRSYSYSKLLRRLGTSILSGLLVTLPAYAGFSTSGYADHQVIVGDFNGDGWGDLLFQALPGNNGEALLLSMENGSFGSPVTWSDEAQGTDWNASAHQLIVGDFNGDGRDDLFMQAAPGLASGVMLSNGQGGFTRPSQGAFTAIGGLDVSQATHTAVVGDFNGDGRDDLLLQANDGMHQNGIALAGPNGNFTTLAAEWPSNALGLNWSNELTAITAGDFSGTGHAELLLRSRGANTASGACCQIVALGSQLKPSTVVQSWKPNWLGLDWSPADYTLIAADLNGDGRTDLLLQPTAPSGEVTVLLANAQGRFTGIAAQWPAEQNGRDWSSESYQLVAEPAAAAGQGGSLLLVPKQPGLAYARVQFDTSGQPGAVTTLTAPPAGLFSSTGSDPSAAQLSAAPNSTNPDTTTNSAVGTLSGKFSVGPMGAAHYTIPIDVAPGVNGVQPQLALNYNSESGVSWLGLGWTLSGLSAISRCPATMAADGVSHAVELNDNDRFCLDGEHLIAYAGQPYGGNGTEYHTPTASFQKITSNSSQTSGPPQSFTVWDKGGLIRTYGTTSDSRIQAGSDYSNTVMTWLLEKITDRWGNSITFHYTKEQDVSETPGADTSYQVTEIDYGNNAGAVVGKVIFNYRSLTAYGWNVSYMHGVAHIIKDELTSIEVDSGGSELWTYDIAYTDSPGPSQVASINQCDAAGACFKNPISFTYAPASVGLRTKNQYLQEVLASDATGPLHFGDFYGEGITDYAYAKNSYWYLDGIQTALASGPAPDQALVLDANGDGHSDLIYPVNSGIAYIGPSTL